MSRLLSLAAAGMLALALVACGGSGPQPTPAGTPGATVELDAHNTAFDEAQLAVPANETFAIDFNNGDSAPHNVAIHGNGVARTGEIFTGPGQRTYVFAGLPAGTYQFLCEVHPQMTGTLVVS